jgi:hypothetical protein
LPLEKEEQQSQSKNRKVHCLNRQMHYGYGSINVLGETIEFPTQAFSSLLQFVFSNFF